MNRITLIAAASLLAGSATMAVAHHSFVAQYDPAKPKTISGAVTKVEWTNPHAHFYVDVKAADGKVVNFAVEMGSTNKLMRYGWNRSTMKIGDQVTVEGFEARDGSPLINAKAVKFGDGRQIAAGSSLEQATY
jgi:Family of unknown function (DUF6152)